MHVFLSHANQDKPRIKPLVERLLDENIPVWIDRPDELGLDERYLQCGRIRSGADWLEQLEAALDASACVLFVLSKASNAADRSDSLYREFQYGVRKDSLVMVSIDPKDSFQQQPQYRLRQSFDLSALVAGDRTNRGANTRLAMILQDLRAGLAKAGRTADAQSEGEPDFGPMWPYFTDRVAQQRLLTEVLSHAWADKVMLPLTFVALGTDEDCLYSFVKQVRHTRLPRLLTSRFSRDRLLEETFVWSPDDTGTYASLESEVHELLASQLKLGPDASRQEIADRLSAAQGCWLLQLNLSLDIGADRCSEALRAWLKWWASPEFRSLEHPLITVVCITASPSWLLQLIMRHPATVLRRAIQALQAGKQKGRVHVLPKFRRLRFMDVEAIIHKLGKDIDPENFRLQLRRYFCFLGLRLLPGRRLSMFKAADCIKRLVKTSIMKVAHD